MIWKNKFPQENRYFETDKGILYCGDCLEIMKKFPEKIFDAIITDPPYGTTACKWDVVIPFEDMWRELKRIRKDRTSVVLFGSEPFSSYLRLSNIKEYKYDWIWNKVNISNPLLAKKQPLRCHEIISVFYKKQCKYFPQKNKGKKWHRGGKKEHTTPTIGKISLINKGSDKSNLKYPKTIIIFSNADKTKNFHPTQKPLALLEYLVKTYTNEGDLVLDFTCGSGTTLLACEKLNRRWIGIEINKEYCEISKQRIMKLQKDLL